MLLVSLVLVLLLVNLILNLRRKQKDYSPELRILGETINKDRTGLESALRQEISTNRREFLDANKEGRTELGLALDQFGSQQRGVFELVNKQVGQLVQSNENRFQRLQDSTVTSLDKIRLHMEQKLSSIQNDHQVHMDKMRQTVDEKLHKTLEERLGRSFQLVSANLEKVQKGLGEMQHLAAGVGDLKKVLSNVKTRGILGEIQLLNIIEEILTPEQFDLNVATVPGRDSRVEVAIKMPGQKVEHSCLYLPIDSKFPMDRYAQLNDAYEEGCPIKIQEMTKALHRALLVSAKDIRTKYIAPPYTTDFAIMFLPVEGLYAEISRSPTLMHRLRTEFQILVVGPNNLSAFLSSLQMGFRTLAIERRSSEVWTMLGGIKTEFGKFGVALDKVQKKLTEAHNVIEQAGTRRRVLEKKLNKVEELPIAGSMSSGSLAPGEAPLISDDALLMDTDQRRTSDDEPPTINLNDQLALKAVM